MYILTRLQLHLLFPLIYALYKFNKAGHIGLLVIVHTHVAAVRAIQIAAICKLGSHPLHVFRVHGIVLPANAKGWYCKLWQVGNTVPFQQLA